MICAADTVGVFQIESRAQMSMLPRLRPRRFYDLVIEVAIVRPGPIQGGMVHPYLRRRNGQEPVAYPSKALEAVLGKTLGVPLFQEQAMRLAVVAAGFTPGEADQLRRAMGAWRRNGRIEQFRSRLIEGMTGNGYSAEFAERCFRQISGFGEYGFPESHAASFALLVYVSAWLKRYHPAAFAAALINSQPMGFYAPAQIIRDVQGHGARVLPPDVNHSAYDCMLEWEDQATEGRRDEGETTKCQNVKTSKREGREPETELRCDREGATKRRDGGMQGRRNEGSPVENRCHQGRKKQNNTGLRPCVPQSLCPWIQGKEKQRDDPASRDEDGPALRLGFRLVRGLSDEKVRGIEAARREGPITSIPALARRPDVSRETLVRLAAADAFRSLGLNRREALWQVLAAQDEPGLFDELEPDEPKPKLPPIDLSEQVVQDYDTIGLSLAAHPISLVRNELAQLGVKPNATLKRARHRQRIAVSGLVLVRQRPGTANGIVFMTLEDETGVANLIIRPQVWDRWRRATRTSVAIIAEGLVERQSEVVHVAVGRMADLSDRLGDLRSKSRDFH
jgi:error-prone DNA polymerase